MTNALELIPLGGMGQFGMNCCLLKSGSEMIMIDSGMAFPRGYQRSIPGVSLMAPDLSALQDIDASLLGIVLTHGHEDHTGSLAYTLEKVNVPVYGGALTLGLARSRLEERKLIGLTELVEIRAGEEFSIGNFSITPIEVDHSFPGSFSFVIRTGAGTLIWTGDFKLENNGREYKPGVEAAFASLGKAGVLALMSDSTNSCAPGFSPPEESVHEPLRELFRKADRKIVVSTFASSIKRIQFILDLAGEFERMVIPIGRSMVRNIRIAQQLNCLNVPEGILCGLKEAPFLPADKMVVLASGSQGEPLSALTRLANEQVREVKIEKGDTVIFSTRKIPGNENSINWVINQFYRHGAVVYDCDNSRIHASGHAYSEELGRMVELVQPEFFIPIHGDFRQLKTHAAIAESKGIPEDKVLVIENGDHLRLDRKEARIINRFDLAPRFIDEEFLDEVDEIILRERRHLSVRGLVVVIIRLDSMTGIQAGEPEFTFRGFLDRADYQDMAREAGKKISKIIARTPLAEKRNAEAFGETLRIETRRFFKKLTGKKPVVIPFIVEV